MDIRDSSGNVLYRIDGNRIYNTHGKWVLEKRGDYIFDSTGNRRYEVQGNRIYDTQGHWVLEIVDTFQLEIPVPLNRQAVSFCANCKNELTQPLAFCGFCGASTGVPQAPSPKANIPNAPATKRSATRNTGPKPKHPFKGRLLVSDNGKKYLKTRTGSTVIVVIIAIVFVIAGFIMANQLGYRNTIGSSFGHMFNTPAQQVRTGFWYIFVWGGIFGAAGMIIWDIAQRVHIGKTNIFVYEDGVIGVGVGPKYGSLSEDSITTFDFQLTYDRITSADVSNRIHVVINAQGKQYLIGVANPDKIVAAINERMRLSKSGLSLPHW